MSHIEFEEINVKPEGQPEELTIEQQQSMGIVKFNLTDQGIADLKEKYSGLTVAGVEDKAGLKTVYEARQVVKKKRVAIEKYAEQLKENALAYQKKVNDEKNRVVGELKGIESALQDEEDRIDALKEQARKEAEEAENKRVQERINQLAVFGFEIPYVALKSLDDEAFESMRLRAETMHNEEVKRLAEEKRIADEKAEQDRLDEEKRLADLKKEQDAEKERLRLEKEQFDKEQAEAKKKQDLLDAENERIRLEQKAAQDKIDAQLKQIQDEKDAAEKKRLQDIEDARILKEKEDEKADIAEKARLKTIQDIEDKRIADEKAEHDRIAEENRKLALRPDKEKIQAFADLLQNLEYPEVGSEEAKKIVENIQTLMGRTVLFISKQLTDL